MLGLTPQDLLTLLSLVSKACLIPENLPTSEDHFENAQFRAAVTQCVPILKRFDAENRSLLPVPHDGTPWSERE
jgi:hypothetical protein